MADHEDISALQTDFRAIVNQGIFAAGNDPEHPQTQRKTEILVQQYATYLEKNRIYISGKNSIPEFRRVILLGPDYHSDFVTGLTCGIAVTSDGRLVTGFFTHSNSTDQKPTMTSRAIRILNDIYKMTSPTDTEKTNLEFIDGHVGFYLDASYGWNKSYTIDYSNYDDYTRIKIKDFLYEQINHRLALACRAITTSLDSNVQRDIQENNLIKMLEGRWLTGGDGVTADVITARQQAVRAYPLLAKTFHENSEFCDVIDTKASLSKAIAGHFNVDKSRVRRLSGLSWQHVGSEPKSVSYNNNIISKFLCLSGKCFPKTREQFQNLVVLERFGRFVYNEDLIKFTDRLSKNGDPWRFIDRMKQTRGTNVSDAIDFLALKLLCPVMIYRSQSQISFDDAMKKARYEIRKYFKFRELLDWSDRYHRNIARYEDRLDIIIVNRDWPGMLGTIDLGNGCIVRELTSAVELKAQGRAEDHCVGGYVSRVLDREDHVKGQATLIFSLEQNDRILSTVEIRCFREHSASNECRQMRKETLRAHVVQNLAYSNASPCCMALELAKQVVTRVQQAGPETFRTYLDGLLHEARVKQDRISEFEHYIVECGLDPHNRTHLEIVWNELGPTLPQRFRKNGFNAFITHGLSRATCRNSSPEMQSCHQNHMIHSQEQLDMQSERSPEHDGP